MDAQEKRILIAIVGTALVFGTVMVTLIYLLVRQHRRSLRLQREARMIEFNALEKERMRLAADLHDELSPMLTAVKLGINNIQPCHEEDGERLLKAHQYIGELSKKMREVSFDLMPEVLTRKGVYEAVREFTSYISRNHPLKIHLHLPDNGANAVTGIAAVQVYRIIQEIIHNTVRHSGASDLHISITSSGDDLLIKTADNGKGFDPLQKSENSEGMGLKTIQGRVELLSGESKLESRPGGGTQYNIEIPLKQQ